MQTNYRFRFNKFDNITNIIIVTFDCCLPRLVPAVAGLPHFLTRRPPSQLSSTVSPTS